MLSLPVPTLDHKTIYEISRERFQDEAYVQRLVDGQDDVLAWGVRYTERAQAGALNTIAEAAGVPSHIPPGDMQTLYKQGFLRKGSEARKHYERLRLSSPYRVCPFCLHRSVKTLDHFLPKKKFGAFSVLPSNLIPSCRDCNSEKDEFATLDRAATLIHPYFDNVDTTMWLSCEIGKLSGYCAPTFFIDSAEADPTTLGRLESHMEVLDLFELYDIEGARELNDMSGTLRDAFSKSGQSGVKALCESMGASRSALAVNYWRAVLWRTAANDDEFCSLAWLA